MRRLVLWEPDAESIWYCMECAGASPVVWEPDPAAWAFLVKTSGGSGGRGPDTCYSRGKWGPGLTPRWYPDVSRETMTSATSTWSDSPRPSLAPDAFLSSGVSRETPDGIAPQCPRGTVTSFLTEIQGNREDSLLTQGDVAHGITQVTAGEGQPAPYVGWDRAWFTRRPGPLAAS